MHKCLKNRPQAEGRWFVCLLRHTVRFFSEWVSGPSQGFRRPNQKIHKYSQKHLQWRLMTFETIYFPKLYFSKVDFCKVYLFACFLLVRFPVSLAFGKNGQQWTTMDSNGQQFTVLHATVMPFLFAKEIPTGRSGGSCNNVIKEQIAMDAVVEVSCCILFSFFPEKKTSTFGHLGT